MSEAAGTWVTVGIWTGALLLAGARLGALGGARLEHRRAVRFAARCGLPGEVGADLVRRVARRQRFVLAGLALGAPASVAAAVAVGTVHEAGGGPRYWRGRLPVPA